MSFSLIRNYLRIYYINFLGFIFGMGTSNFIALVISISFVFAGVVRGQLDGIENWHLSQVLCDTLKFHEVHRVMRLDVNCYQHIGQFENALCVEVIYCFLKIEILKVW